MTARVPPRLPLALGLLALMVAVVALAPLDGTGTALLHLAPALLLVLPLLRGRYVGEDAIAALAARVRPPRRAPRALRAAVSRAPRALAPRGGRLLAARLAERGPPRAALAV